MDSEQPDLRLGWIPTPTAAWMYRVEGACMDVEAGRPVSLSEYDEKLVDKRLKRAARLLQRLAWTYPVDPEAFYVGGGHIVFCFFDGAGARHDLPVP